MTSNFFIAPPTLRRHFSILRNNKIELFMKSWQMVTVGALLLRIVSVCTVSFKQFPITNAQCNRSPK